MLLETKPYGAVAAVPIADPETKEIRQVSVMAGTTDTPGLIIVPEMRQGRLSGSWVLVHAASGHLVPTGGWGGNSFREMQDVASALKAVPVDWVADKEAVVAQIAEHKGALLKAIHDGRYPVPEPDPEGTPAGEGPAPYPRTDVQATAEAIARGLTRALQHRNRDTWELVKRDDAEGRALYDGNAYAAVAEWGLVSVLRAFARVDQQAADHAAREVWRGWEDGSTVHELTYDWAKEYGLPDVPGESAPAAAPTLAEPAPATA